MCTLCAGDFAAIPTVEVGRAALLEQRLDHFGEAHVCVEDGNLDDLNLQYLAANPKATIEERIWARMMLQMNEDERDSSHALAHNLWGAFSIHSRPKNSAA